MIGRKSSAHDKESSALDLKDGSKSILVASSAVSVGHAQIAFVEALAGKAIVTVASPHATNKVFVEGGKKRTLVEHGSAGSVLDHYQRVQIGDVVARLVVSGQPIPAGKERAEEQESNACFNVSAINGGSTFVVGGIESSDGLRGDAIPSEASASLASARRQGAAMDEQRSAGH